MRNDYMQSKITVPQVFHKLLPRKNIGAIIDGASRDEMVWLVAPFGCGKTLSVISWLREHSRNAAWATLDKTDNTEQAFFAGLSAAMMRHAGWQGDVNSILTDAGYVNDPQDYFGNAVSNAEEIGCDTILVIDGFSFVQDPGLLRSMKNALFPLLGRWRVIIISRSELPSIFNDLLLKRRICLITLNELNFSPEEIAGYFSINEYAATEQEVLQISGETEGWPAALNVVLTLSRGGPLCYGGAARDYVKGFFESEVWEGLHGDIRDFLLKTSVLEKLTPAACNAVTDTGATLPILRWLFVNGIFVSRLNESDTYRYQRVFVDFLRDKLRESGLDESALYKKIAWRLFERDEFERAFHYFFKAGDYYGLNRLFRIINSAEMGLERYLKLTGCITSLNVEELRAYPLLVAKMALINYALGNLPEMQRLYDKFMEWIEPGALPLPPEEYAECVWEGGWLSYLNPAEPVLNNQKHEEWFNYMEDDPRLKTLHYSRAAVYRFPSILRGIRDYCPALNTLEEYVGQNKDTGYSTIDNEVSLWRLDIVRAEYAYELEKFGVAEGMIRGIMGEAERNQIADLYFVCTALLVKIVRAAHDPKEIEALTARLEAMIHRSGQTFLLPRFHAFALRNRLAQGIPGQTETFENENENYMTKPYFYLFYRHMTLARALISTGNHNETILLLGNLERLCHQYGRIMDLIEVTILKAVAEYGLGYEDRACHWLMDAIDQARKYGFIRIFSDDAQELWPLLGLVAEERDDAYVKRIAISCKKTLARAGIKLPQKNRTQAGLTKTELKILKILYTDMSYEEIALDNNIKISTVKSHIHSIYSKLEVDSRTEAVLAARSKGLIERVESERA